jgi:hypothetical protein
MSGETGAGKKEKTTVKPGELPKLNVIEVLKELRKGKTLFDLQDGLQELVHAVRETKRKGKIVFEMGVECRTPGNASSVEITDKVTVKLPEKLRERTTMFTTNKNTLQRTDPRQGTLEGFEEED